jgi:glycine cleavage system H protein
LEDEPALVNQDPAEGGWFFTMKVSNPDELNDLMDEAAYADYVKELG